MDRHRKWSQFFSVKNKTFTLFQALAAIAQIEKEIILLC